MRLLAFISIILLPNLATAYIGPGIGGGLLTALLGIILAIIIFVLSFFIGPVKKLIKLFKSKK